ncbi:MAG: hypothetical protein R3C56_10165 [Pirellulaceae bacterium]
MTTIPTKVGRPSSNKQERILDSVQDEVTAFVTNWLAANVSHATAAEIASTTSTAG